MKYYALVLEEKIVGISQCPTVNCETQSIEITQDVYDHIWRYIYVDGEIVLDDDWEEKEKKRQHQEISDLRAEAYRDEVDPITNHINRLRDAEQTEEIVAEIAELVAERDAKVAEIKERYPYPDEN